LVCLAASLLLPGGSRGLRALTRPGAQPKMRQGKLDMQDKIGR